MTTTESRPGARAVRSATAGTPVRVRARYLYSGIGSLLLGTVVAWVAVGTAWGQSHDQEAMVRVAGHSMSGSAMASAFAPLTVPLTAVVGAMTVAVALTSVARTAALLRAALVFVIPLATAVLIKALLPRPQLTDLVIGNNSFPSGTVTAVSAAAAALVVVTPGPYRILTAAPASVAVVATSYTVLVLRWHRPSDVIAALLLVGGVMMIVSAFSRPEQNADQVLADPGNERLCLRPLTAMDTKGPASGQNSARRG